MFWMAWSRVIPRARAASICPEPMAWIAPRKYSAW